MEEQSRGRKGSLYLGAVGEGMKTWGVSSTSSIFHPALARRWRVPAPASPALGLVSFAGEEPAMEINRGPIVDGCCASLGITNTFSREVLM